VLFSQGLSPRSATDFHEKYDYPYLKSGRLVRVLPQYNTPDADIYAVYPQRHQLAARVRAFVDFIALAFSRQVADNHPS